MDEGFFKLKGKTLVIIDWVNVYGWFKKLKWEISPKKLYDYLKNYPEIFDGVILFSGDGDYAVIVNELIKRRKQVIVVFAKGCKGREYEDFKKGLYLCSVKKLKKQISR